MKNPEFHKVLKRLADIHDKKNTDYASDADPYKNFRKCESAGIPAYKGVYVRICDKVSRIDNFVLKGGYAVKDESFEDTCDDLANYAILLGLLYKEYKACQKSKGSVTSVAKKLTTKEAMRIANTLKN